MCRWLAYSGSPILLREALYTPAHSLVDQSLHSRLGAETTNGDGFGVGWYGDTPIPGVFHSTEPAWNDQQPARARRPHQLVALLHPHTSRDRQRRATDQLPPLPPRALAVHAQRLHQRRSPPSSATSCSPSIRRCTRRSRARPTPRCCSSSRSRSACRTTPGRDRAGDRSGRSDRQPSGGPPPLPGHHRHHRRPAHVGGPLLKRGRVALALLLDRCAHATPALSGEAVAPRDLGGRAADRVRAAGRRRRHLERGARGDLRHRRPGPRRHATVPPQGTLQVRARGRLSSARCSSGSRADGEASRAPAGKPPAAALVAGRRSSGGARRAWRCAGRPFGDPNIVAPVVVVGWMASGGWASAG